MDASDRPGSRDHCRRSLLLATAVFAISAAAAPAHAASTVEVTDHWVVLENEAAYYRFSIPYRGSLESLVDLVSGHDLVGGLPYPAGLFSLQVASGACASQELSVLDPADFAVGGEVTAEGAVATFAFVNLGQRDLGVEARIVLPHDSPRARWSLTVESDDPNLVLREVIFPVVAMPAAIGGVPDDDAVALPILDGIELRQPGEALSVGDALIGTYPSDLSLQMAAFYDDEAGLFMAVHDPTAAPKRVLFGRLDIDGAAALVLAVARPVSQAPGATVSVDAEAIFGPFHGDWFDAAVLYRQWALQQSWAPPPLAQRTDVPRSWTSVEPVISSVSYGDDGTPWLPASLMPERAAEYAAVAGGPVALLTFGWEQHGAWTSPGFFPPRDGEEAFAAAMAALKSAGNLGYVYLSGTVWRLSRTGLPDYDDSARFLAEGAASAALTCDGSVYYDPFYASLGWVSARMCPAASGWQELEIDNIVTAAELGIGAVSVDEFPVGSIYDCHATDHGHSPGSGAWQVEAYRSTLREARTRARAIDPEIVFTCEEPGEPYLDLLDGYVSRSNQPDGMMYVGRLLEYGDLFRPVPLFSAVYHDRIVAVAEHTVIHDAWDGSGALETLRTSLVRGLAAGFVLGKVPSASVVPAAQADPALLDLFARAARATRSWARAYAILGTMERPLVLDVPMVAFEGVWTDLASGEVQLFQQSSQSVLASAWRSPTGGRAVLLANITEFEQSFDLALPRPDAGAPFVASLVADGVRTTLAEGDDLPVSVRVTLQPLAVAMVEVASRPWRRAGGRATLPE